MGWQEDLTAWIKVERFESSLQTLLQLGARVECLALWTDGEMAIPEPMVRLLEALGSEARERLRGGEVTEQMVQKRDEASMAWLRVKDGVMSDVLEYCMRHPKNRLGVKEVHKADKSLDTIKSIKLLNWLKDRGEPVKKSSILKRFPTWGAATIEGILSELKNENKITSLIENNGTIGRPAQKYWAI